MGWQNIKIVNKKLSDFKLRWIPIIFKSFVIAICLSFNLFVRKALCPLIPFAQVKRYIESIVNLICMRVILITLGIFKLDSDSFTYFSKDTAKITLKSGFIGIGTHKSIVDFLYYSYIFNPVFVRLIIYKREDKEEVFYAPLAFTEALQCAIYYRGFDPIIIHNEKQFKNVKYRKLAMKTLVSECFQEINGPIFILLPGLHPQAHLSLNKTVANDIYDNQIRFQRSLVGLIVKIDERVLPKNEIYRNQIMLLFELMSRFMWFSFQVDAIEYRKWKLRYDRVTYPSFVDKFYENNKLKIESMDYEAYLQELNEFVLQKESSQKVE